MGEWFEFYLQAIKDIVATVFSLDTGLGFSLGDIEVALLAIGLVASALVIKVSNSAGGSIHDSVSSHNRAVDRSNASQRSYYSH